METSEVVAETLAALAAPEAQVVEAWVVDRRSRRRQSSCVVEDAVEAEDRSERVVENE